MEDIELEALNQFEKRLYDDEYRSVVNQAFTSIYNAYLEHRNPSTLQPAQRARSVISQKRLRSNEVTIATEPSRKRYRSLRCAQQKQDTHRNTQDQGDNFRGTLNQHTKSRNTFQLAILARNTQSSL
ncbi:hypothetical protein BO82DRAFT_94219 [Aspergillus uvarum CBS 121591]|uniref:Uncharacterized protein n=1 Tax=Aspergillus uvarum CBS 121591 TaxID=1448315 RepID=A0A319C6C5_9EURO|nr:hypothetical protein BO82DRAFT_94219 [Aspergillus uvarum CBS 121591]PYH81376.1 hypothetical protein BO82DRAFT_94219 [Aspergillus uvarum CBS 121591]